MNGIIFSVLVVIVAGIHLAMKRYLKCGDTRCERIKTTICAGWFIDAVFAVGGTILSFLLYQYVFYPYFTVRNVMLILAYLLATLLFVWITPTGIGVFQKSKSRQGEVFAAEYHLNETLEMVRNCFLFLLFLLPIMFLGTEFEVRQENQICGGFCFVAFLVLVPISLRQSLFWMKNIMVENGEGEEKFLRRYQMRLRYRHRNYKI